jgi:hypothetical protein
LFAGSNRSIVLEGSLGFAATPKDQTTNLPKKSQSYPHLSASLSDLNEAKRLNGWNYLKAFSYLLRMRSF